MLMDIFSSFDIYEFYSTKLFSFMSIFMLLMTLIIIFMLMSNLWMKNFQFMSMVIYPLNVIYSQSERTTTKFIKGYSLYIIPLFIMLIFSNMGGLISYSLSLTSHLMFTLIMALPLWLAMIISSMNYNKKQYIANLLPSGAPNWLNPFLVLIETVSIFVRPLTLSFRLAANMTAGHIVLSLVGSYLTMALSLMPLYPLILFFIMVGYILFEVAICAIQAYIFCLLLTLYTDDHTQLMIS
nr:TPA: ATPase F0 subunit 6 [Cylicobdellidae sp. FA-2019]